MDKDIIGVTTFWILIFIVIFQIISWITNTTLSPSWECTKWHVVGKKDNQSGVCDQYSRKVK
jgi:hypothetical protein